MAVTPAQRLRELLAQPNVEIMPGCYDALSAKLVADAGYKVTFMSGFAVSAARLGLPDTGLISFTEMLDKCVALGVEGVEMTGGGWALRDSLTGASTDRKAAGVRMGYGRDKVQFSSGLEFRRDLAEQLDTTHTRRTAWLFRNNFKLQLTPDGRVIGKLDHSISDSSLGAFYAGGYTEAVAGYAYRPVKHWR